MFSKPFSSLKNVFKIENKNPEAGFFPFNVLLCYFCTFVAFVNISLYFRPAQSALPFLKVMPCAQSQARQPSTGDVFGILIVGLFSSVIVIGLSFK